MLILVKWRKLANNSSAPPFQRAQGWLGRLKLCIKNHNSIDPKSQFSTKITWLDFSDGKLEKVETFSHVLFLGKAKFHPSALIFQNSSDRDRLKNDQNPWRQSCMIKVPSMRWNYNFKQNSYQIWIIISAKRSWIYPLPENIIVKYIDST